MRLHGRHEDRTAAPALVELVKRLLEVDGLLALVALERAHQLVVRRRRPLLLARVHRSPALLALLEDAHLRLHRVEQLRRVGELFELGRLDDSVRELLVDKRLRVERDDHRPDHGGRDEDVEHDDRQRGDRNLPVPERGRLAVDDDDRVVERRCEQDELQHKRGRVHCHVLQPLVAAAVGAMGAVAVAAVSRDAEEEDGLLVLTLRRGPAPVENALVEELALGVLAMRRLAGRTERLDGLLALEAGGTVLRRLGQLAAVQRAEPFARDLVELVED
mmetsp:Transcript_31012/g.84853  ORF Transcript_31012/g.84853 Transcript_31012/m.84853 type:complete len:275 (+) Transcript_31012:995-1819(+)